MRCEDFGGELAEDYCHWLWFSCWVLFADLKAIRLIDVLVIVTEKANKSA